MTSLVLVEPGDELSLQALGFARSLGDVRAVLHRRALRACGLGGRGRGRQPVGADAIVAAGSDHGNEVLAHVAARLDQPFAANCTADRGRRRHARSAGAAACSRRRGCTDRR